MLEKCNKGVNRRDFLIGATTVGTLFLTQGKSSSATNSELKPAKGEVYEKAKKVYDLAREAWHPEREDYRRIHAGGVVGILDLSSTGPNYDGPGYYLHLRRDDIVFRTQLVLTAVGYIDRGTTREIDKCLANLGLIYTPPTKGIDQNLVEQIYKVHRGGGITSTNVALRAIWVDKILRYAREHKFPVLSLCSMDLTSLNWMGIGANGEVPSISNGTLINLGEGYIPQEVVDSVISEKYVPLLIRAIVPLEMEVKRVNNIRSNKLRVTEEKMLEAQAALKRLQQSESGQDIPRNKLPEKPVSLVDRILEFPIP